MLNKWKSKGLRERVEMLRGKDLLKLVLLRVGLRFKTSLGSIRGCLIKFLKRSLRLVMIGFFLTLSLKM